MTDEGKLAHLKRLCSTERTTLMLPFLITHDDKTWSMASDGRVLLAWSGKLKGVEERRDAPRIPKDWIEGALSASGATTAAALRDWSGTAKFPSMQDCSACKGTGKAVEYHQCNCEYCEADDEITVDCFDCDGEKKVLTEDVRYGIIGGTAVNRNYFAMLLDGIDGTVCVDPGDGRYEQVRLRGDDWFAIVMPVNREGLKPEQIDAEPFFQV